MWLEESINFLKNNYNILTIDEIADKVNKSRRTVVRKANEFNLTNGNKKWSEEDIKLLRNVYQNEKMEDICLFFPNRNSQSIMTKANRIGLIKLNKNTGIKSRKYTCDFNYFNDINTSNKAYYLGWAYTDGNISGCQYRIRLHKKDKDILEKFNKDIMSSYLIYERDKYVEINITNKDFVFGLNKNGCFERKTRTLEFPNIRQEFIFDFIKGVFDGDGSYGCTNKTHKISLVSGSFNFIKSIKNILLQNNISCCLLNYKTYYVLEIKAKKSLRKYLEIVLNTSSDFLNRKKEKMIELYEYTNKKLTVKSSR